MLVAALFAQATPVASYARASERATAGPLDAQRTAYLYGIKCYVANGAAASDPRYNSRAADLKTKAKKSYDVIWYMGRALGTSDALIHEDIDSYQAMLTDAFVRDDHFFQRIRSECIKLGLM